MLASYYFLSKSRSIWAKAIGFSSEPHFKNIFNMKKYKITYKEVNRPNSATTTYEGTMSEAQVIEFFGLNEPEVEWYKIETIND